ncbi:MAG: hypothetical protein LBQ02_01880 [Candidatus Nomurabacteria bacterium]|jgi:hypothetical protein|nr:hypothetical protein [Candidatus Nomurabacteria bacterium]
MGGGNPKNHIREGIKKVRPLRTWQLVLILIVLLPVVLSLLRLDNIGMLQRREAVESADESGNEEALKNRLIELQDYVFTHMNASTGAFYLDKQYERDAAQVLERAGQDLVNNDSNPNGNIYKKASEVCDPQFHVKYSQAHIACMMRELEKYPSMEEISDTALADLPDTELYRREYVSPFFTFGVTGATIALTAILAVVIITRFLIYLSLRIMLIFYKNS